MTWTVPNILTLLRLAFIPLFVGIYFIDWQWAHQAAAFIFWLAAITDWFDGYLARRLGQSTEFGAFLDPVADKLIVAAALLMISYHYQSAWITICAIILLGREIIISSLREWMGQRGMSEAVSVSFIGKAKTMTQMLALIGLLSELEVLYWVTLGKLLLIVATVLSVWSMVIYLKAGWPSLTRR